MSFKTMSTSELIDYIKGFYLARKIKQLHIHHTWKPEHKDYNGSNSLELQNSMRNYHVKSLGWSDIGQHLTLLPDGQWITGRDFNVDPASISGWNNGAFAIEMLGNFDIGHDRFEGKQKESIIEFCAFFVTRMNLNLMSDIKFHRDNPSAGKSCPGTGIDKDEFLINVDLKISESEEEIMDGNQIKEALGIKDTDWKQKQVELAKKTGLIVGEHEATEVVDMGTICAMFNNLFNQINQLMFGNKKG